MADISVVVLTMGDRPESLRAAIESARAQRGADIEVIIVWNGAPVGDADADIHIVLEENVGIPEGRNRGAKAATSRAIAFLDDDGRLATDTVLRDALAILDEPKTGVVGLQVVAPDGSIARRHRPGLLGTGAAPSGRTSFPGGACLVQTGLFRELGGLCGQFFYGLEETDYAWRVIAAGYDVIFAPHLHLVHPKTDPARHPSFVWWTARNRVWLARRALPRPIGALYLMNWTVVTFARNLGDLPALRSHLAGTIAGLREPVAPGRRLGLHGIWRLTRLRRPPVI